MEKLLTAKEAAEILNCHKQTVYRNRELPCINIPGVGKRFKESELNKYLEQKSTFSHLDTSNNLPFTLVAPIYNMGGVNCEMPKGKNKTRYNFGFGAIYQRKTKEGNIRWCLDYRDGNGKRIQRVAPLATTKEEATVALKEELRSTFDSEYRVKREIEKLRFSELADMYLENYAKPNKKSWKSDKYRIGAHLVPFLGDLELQNINPLLIEKYRAERLKIGVKKSTLNRELALIKKMFNLAMDWNLTTTNPALKVKSFPEKDNRTERILLKEEENRLLQESAEHLKPILIVALNTGMRRGEILNLKWSQVDLLSKKIRVEKTKSGKIRFINLNTSLLELLSDLKKKNGKNEHVFFNHRTGERLTTVKTAFNAACRRSKIENLRFHDLRHTFATRLVEKGVDLITVKELLGHSSVTITERYTHSYQQQKKMAVELLVETTHEKPKNQGDLLHSCYTGRKTEKTNGTNALFSIN